MNTLKWYPLIFIMCFCLIPCIGVGGQKENSPSKQNNEFEVLLWRHQSQEVEKIPLKEYLYGVVSAEMQANYHAEALKAQAVAACTYTIYRYENYIEGKNTDSPHPDAYVCDDYTHCKSFLTYGDAKSRWGEAWFDKYYPNIESAVDQVYGQVITYEGDIINAVFHAISSGTTESAENVWGSAIPYLVSVNSSLDTTAKGYQSEVTFTEEEARACLDTLSVSVGGTPDKWFSSPILDSAGSVQTVTICGMVVKGTDLRRAFGLRSTAFSVTADDKKITFTVRGYGHQVGLSQNGANEMAKQGKSYSEILKHYYSGVEIQNYNF